MLEKEVMIPAEGGITLEACYTEGKGDEHVWVLLHPHPLYGGSMDNNVVQVLHRAFHGRGFSTLRYNSRGVGQSGGTYDDGNKECDDLLHVVDYLKKVRSYSNVHVAAYSFGSWIALKTMSRGGWKPQSLFLVSPPLDFMTFDGLFPPLSITCAITLGDRDEYCKVSSLHRWVEGWKTVDSPVRVEILAGCDHFYWGHEQKLRDVALSWLEGKPDQL